MEESRFLRRSYEQEPCSVHCRLLKGHLQTKFSRPAIQFNAISIAPNNVDFWGTHNHPIKVVFGCILYVVAKLRIFNSYLTKTSSYRD